MAINKKKMPRNYTHASKSEHFEIRIQYKHTEVNMFFDFTLWIFDSFVGLIACCNTNVQSIWLIRFSNKSFPLNALLDMFKSYQVSNTALL